MKHTVLIRITSITLVLLLALCEGASASPIHDNGQVLIKRIVDPEDPYEKNGIPEPASVTMAKGYLEVFSSLNVDMSQYSAEIALMQLSDNIYPEMVIWDHEKGKLSIYKMSESGIAFFCGSIGLPKYNGFVWGNQYHIYYHEGQGILYAEISLSSRLFFSLQSIL